MGERPGVLETQQADAPPPVGCLDGPAPEEVREFKVAVLGGVGAGKTSLVQAICGIRGSREYCPTIGTQVVQLLLPISRGKKKFARINFWEVSSSHAARFGYMPAAAKAGANAVLLVASLADRKGFDDLASEVAAHEALPVVLAATKEDLVASRVVTGTEMLALANKSGVPLVLVGNPPPPEVAGDEPLPPVSIPASVADVLAKLREICGV